MSENKGVAKESFNAESGTNQPTKAETLKRFEEFQIMQDAVRASSGNSRLSYQGIGYGIGRIK